VRPSLCIRALALVGTTLAVSTVSVASFANASGLAGYSGKPNLAAPAGESCNKCHAGGAAPTVSLTGPASLAAGTTGTYSLVVKTTASRAAGGIAATDGIVLTPVSNLRDSFGEMVPNGGVAASGGQATFTFEVRAPLTGTALQLWAVGLAENGNGGTSGDKAAHTTLNVTVTGGAPPALDAGGSGTDASTGSPSDGGTSGGTFGTSGTGGASGSSGTSGTGGTSGSSGTSGTGGTSGTSGQGRGDDNAAPGTGGSGDGGGEGASCSSSPIFGANGAGERSGWLLAALGIVAVVSVRRRRRST
jgi:hypothetical protein